MSERMRARYKNETVTVLDSRIKRTGKTRVRNAHGFVIEVSSRELKPIPENERGSRLRYDDE